MWIIVAAVAAVLLAVAWFVLKPSAQKKFLDKTRKRVQILDVVPLSADVKRFRVSLGDGKRVLGLQVGKHVRIFAPNVVGSEPGKWNGRDDKEHGKTEIERNYTPVTGDETLGHVDLVIKMYRPGKVMMPDGKEVTWTDGGKMTRHLDSKKPGDFIEIFGPVGIHEYFGNGTFKIPGRTVTTEHVCMIAGGAGITPMLQMLRQSLPDTKDPTKFTLLFANKTEDDILCKDLIEELKSKYPHKFFNLNYTLDFPPADWTYRKGFINQEMIKETFPPPSEEPFFALCGPPPMVEFACKKNLEALGYAKDLICAW